MTKFDTADSVKWAKMSLCLSNLTFQSNFENKKRLHDKILCSADVK